MVWQQAMSKKHAKDNVFSPSLLISGWQKEITHYQKVLGIVVPRAPFNRLVREIVNDLLPPGINIHMALEALAALHLATEEFIVTYFQLMYVLNDR